MVTEVVMSLAPTRRSLATFSPSGRRWLAVVSVLAFGLLLFPGKGQLLVAEENGSAAPRQAPRLSRSDKTFLLHAAEENQAAIELGQVVARKGLSASARNFARSLVAQRSLAQQELVAVARRVHLILPLQLSRSDRKVKQQLEKHSGAPVDRLFLTRMATDLDRQYGSYEDTAMSTRNPVVKSYIENLLSDVKHQDQVAKTMAPSEDTNSSSEQ
jgi:putative membrane protein